MKMMTDVSISIKFLHWSKFLDTTNRGPCKGCTIIFLTHNATIGAMADDDWRKWLQPPGQEVCLRYIGDEFYSSHTYSIWRTTTMLRTIKRWERKLLVITFLVWHEGSIVVMERSLRMLWIVLRGLGDAILLDFSRLLF
jgi:hypothetical protein